MQNMLGANPTMLSCSLPQMNSLDFVPYFVKLLSHYNLGPFGCRVLEDWLKGCDKTNGAQGYGMASRS